MAAKMSFQRVFILSIVVVFLVGTIGAYLLVLFNNDDTNNTDVTTTETSQQEELKVDPTAYVVKDSVTTLEKTDLKVGNGPEVKAGDTIKVQYKGSLAKTGQVFDQTNGQAIELPLEGVIQGWQEGIPGMKVGGTRRLVIPAAMAYGNTPVGSIPANSDLVFEVTVDAITQSK